MEMKQPRCCSHLMEKHSKHFAEFLKTSMVLQEKMLLPFWWMLLSKVCTAERRHCRLVRRSGIGKAISDAAGRRLDPGECCRGSAAGETLGRGCGFRRGIAPGVKDAAKMKAFVQCSEDRGRWTVDQVYGSIVRYRRNDDNFTPSQIWSLRRTVRPGNADARVDRVGRGVCLCTGRIQSFMREFDKLMASFVGDPRR